MTADSSSEPRRLPRFSLRSLILFVLLVGSGYGLWVHWEPWALRCVLDVDGRIFRDGRYGIAVTRFRLSRDGKRMISLNRGAAKLWDTESGKLIARLPDTWDAAFSVGGDNFTTAGPYRFQIFNSNSAEVLWKSPTIESWNHDVEIGFILEVTPGGHAIVSWDPYGSGHFLYSMTEWHDGIELSPPGGSSWVNNRRGAPHFTPDGQYILIGPNQPTIYRTDTGQPVAQITDLNLSNHPPHPFLGEDQNFLGDIEGREGHEILKVWDAATGTLIRKVGIADVEKMQHSRDISLSANKGNICGWSNVGGRSPHGGKLTMWDLDSGRALAKRELPIFVKQAQFSPDGHRIFLVGTADDSIRSEEGHGVAWVLDAESLKTMYKLKGDRVNTQDVLIADEGRIISVMSASGVEIWHRHRPEYWWGVGWLPEFWLALVLGVGLGFSLWRDSRIMRA